jgi:TATA-binding protein-associated factor
MRLQTTGQTLNGAAMSAAQALQYMRKVCSHPALVLEPGNEAHAEALREAAPGATLPLRGTQHAPKLAALRDLLAQAGIGRPAAGGAAVLHCAE